MPRKYTRSGGAHARDRAVGARDPAGGCGTAPPIISDAPGEPPPVARAHTRPLTRRVDDRRARPRVRNGTPRTPRGARRTRFVPARARSSSAPGGAARTGAASGTAPAHASSLGPLLPPRRPPRCTPRTRTGPSSPSSRRRSAASSSPSSPPPRTPPRYVAGRARSRRDRPSRDENAGFRASARVHPPRVRAPHPHPSALALARSRPVPPP